MDNIRKRLLPLLILLFLIVIIVPVQADVLTDIVQSQQYLKIRGDKTAFYDGYDPVVNLLISSSPRSVPT